MKDGECKSDLIPLDLVGPGQILSDWEMGRSLEPGACSVDHVLRLLQRLYALAREAPPVNNKLGGWTGGLYWCWFLGRVVITA